MTHPFLESNKPPGEKILPHNERIQAINVKMIYAATDTADKVALYSSSVIGITFQLMLPGIGLTNNVDSIRVPFLLCCHMPVTVHA
jgi:hypothetical protein